MGNLTKKIGNLFSTNQRLIIIAIVAVVLVAYSPMLSRSSENENNDSLPVEKYVPVPSPSLETAPTVVTPKWTTIYLTSIDLTKNCLEEYKDVVKTADASHKNSKIEYDKCIEDRDNNFDSCSYKCKSLIPGPNLITTENAGIYAEVVFGCQQKCDDSSKSSTEACRTQLSRSSDGFISVVNDYCQ